MTRGIAPDLTGKKYGNLTVVEKVKSDKEGNAQWLCKCSCGNEVVIRAMYLKDGKQKFCCKQCPLFTEPMRCDYTGQKFGRLTAIAYVRSSQGGEAIWSYQCNCGRVVEYKHYAVKIGHTQSCGCLAKERGCYKKPGENTNETLYKVSKRKRTPKWLTKEHKKQIKILYVKAKLLTEKTGVLHHVDHIYPLRGKTSNGLHVPWNLRIITSDDNFHKSNKLPEDVC